VDVAALRSDELVGRRPGGAARALTLVLLATLLALVVSLALLVVGASARNNRSNARDAALAAARTEALHLTTISYRTATADLARILAGATGTLRAQFAAEQPHFADTLASDKSVSVGDVLAVGIVRSSGSTAQADVAVDATVTTTSNAGKAQSVLKHYRMVMRLVQVHGRWLVSDVAFAGEPQ
jgi:Mce-associated membrane protein